MQNLQLMSKKEIFTNLYKKFLTNIKINKIKHKR